MFHSPNPPEHQTIENDFKSILGVKIPSEFYCPISHEIMANPVVMADGQTYEEAYIVDWVNRCNISPVTRKAFPNHSMNLNQALQSQISAFLKEHQLSCLLTEPVLRDLNKLMPGDILLKFQDGSLTNFLITFGSRINRRLYREDMVQTGITHVAIYYGNGEIIEASGEAGLRRRFMGDKNFSWEVFRYQPEGNHIVKLALDLAEALCKGTEDAKKTEQTERPGQYDIKSAVSAVLIKNDYSEEIAKQLIEMAKTLDFTTTKFYCSQFVSLVYGLAAAIHALTQKEKLDIPIKVNPFFILPENLYKALIADTDKWNHVGYLILPPSIKPKYFRLEFGSVPGDHRELDSPTRDLSLFRSIHSVEPPNPSEISEKGYLVEVQLPMEGYQLYQALAFYLKEDPLLFYKKWGTEIKNPESLSALEWKEKIKRPIVIIGPNNEILFPTEDQEEPGEPIFIGYDGFCRYYGFVIEGTITGQELFDHIHHGHFFIYRPLRNIYKLLQKKSDPNLFSHLYFSEGLLFILEQWGKYIQNNPKPLEIESQVIKKFMDAIQSCASTESPLSEEDVRLLFKFFKQSRENSSKQEVVRSEPLTLQWAIQQKTPTFLRILLGLEKKHIIRVYQSYLELAEKTWIQQFTWDFVQEHRQILEKNLVHLREGTFEDFSKNMQDQIAASHKKWKRKATEFYTEFLRVTDIRDHRSLESFLFQLEKAFADRHGDYGIEEKPEIFKQKLTAYEKGIEELLRMLTLSLMAHQNDLRQRLHLCIQALEEAYGTSLDKIFPIFSREDTLHILQLRLKPYQMCDEARSSFSKAMLDFLDSEMLMDPKLWAEQRVTLEAFLSGKKDESTIKKSLMEFLQRPILWVGPNMEIENIEDFGKYSGKPIYLWKSSEGYRPCLRKDIQFPDYERTQEHVSPFVEPDLEMAPSLGFILMPQIGSEEEFPSEASLGNVQEVLHLTEFPILLKKGEQVFMYDGKSKEKTSGFILMSPLFGETIQFPKPNEKPEFYVKVGNPQDIQGLALEVKRHHDSLKEVLLTVMQRIMVLEKRKHGLLVPTSQETALHFLLRMAPPSWAQILHDLRTLTRIYHQPLTFFLREERTLPVAFFEKQIQEEFPQQLQELNQQVILKRNTHIDGVKNLIQILEKDLEREKPELRKQMEKVLRKWKEYLDLYQFQRNGDRLLAIRLMADESLLREKYKVLYQRLSSVIEFNRRYYSQKDRTLEDWMGDMQMPLDYMFQLDMDRTLTVSEALDRQIVVSTDLSIRLEKKQKEMTQIQDEKDTEIARLRKESEDKDRRHAREDGDKDRRHTAAIEALKGSHKRDSDEKDLKHTAAIEALKGSHKRDSDEKDLKHAAEIEALKGSHKLDSDEKDRRHIDEIRTLKAGLAAEMKAVEEEMDKRDQRHVIEMKELEDRYMTEMQKQEQRHETALQAIRQEQEQRHETDMQTIRQEQEQRHETDMQTIREKQAKKRKEIADKLLKMHQTELQQVRDEEAALRKALEQKLADSEHEKTRLRVERDRLLYRGDAHEGAQNGVSLTFFPPGKVLPEDERENLSHTRKHSF